MLAIFGMGVVMGVLAVIGLLRLTMREEPTGCVVVFGSLIFLIFLALIIVPRMVLAG